MIPKTKEDIMGICREFLAQNAGDTSTCDLILAIIAEILDTSIDSLTNDLTGRSPEDLII